MLYHLLKIINNYLEFPGSKLYKYISFRASMAAIMSLFISIFFGEKIIAFLNKKQIKEPNRDLGPDFNDHNNKIKAQIPTMGGVIIILAIIAPVLLWTDLTNIYVLLLLQTTIIMGFIGFIDDYIKVFKKNKNGLTGKFKLLGQCILGLIVGLTMYFHKDIVVRKFTNTTNLILEADIPQNEFIDHKSTKTSIPFFKNNELDYKNLNIFLPKKYTWVIYVIIVTFIVAAVSNGANLTDGLDGLAAGTSSVIGITLGILAYISGNVLLSKYLNIMYIPKIGELAIFCTSFVGACVGFLWYNAYPAQIFMGDTGSLALGAIIATLSICIRKELLIPSLCGIFLIENLSVITQVSYFKYTKKKYGVGKRLFTIAPIHHAFQKQGIHEAKIVSRFWILSIILSIITLVTLKIQ
jgi:phospho-N-acetylmuramoyl-pentapeptide-transferase